MKKTVLALAGLLILLLFCGCDKEPSDMSVSHAESTTVGSVTVINTVTEADVWILPDTEANRKTSLWGTATAAQVKTGESRAVSLCEPGDDGAYLLRAIDTDEFYYSANGIVLRDGWTATLRETEPMNVALEVADEHGVTQQTYIVFVARL